MILQSSHARPAVGALMSDQSASVGCELICGTSSLTEETIELKGKWLGVVICLFTVLAGTIMEV